MCDTYYNNNNPKSISHQGIMLRLEPPPNIT